MRHGHPASLIVAGALLWALPSAVLAVDGSEGFEQAARDARDRVKEGTSI